MFPKAILPLVLVFSGAAVHADPPDDRQAALVLDETVWIAFYDLPSRRFRAIRTAVLTRDTASAARDLSVTAGYLSVEAERSAAVLQAPLRGVVEKLRQMEAAPDTVTLDELDRLFGRVHWLLAQHYLALARQARDTSDARKTSLYLLATTHHIERAVLWSNMAVTRDVHAALEGLRKLAGELRNPETSSRAFRERPVVRAEKLLRKIGEQTDRRVTLPAASESAGEPGAEGPQS